MYIKVFWFSEGFPASYFQIWAFSFFGSDTYFPFQDNDSFPRPFFLRYSFSSIVLTLSAPCSLIALINWALALLPTTAFALLLNIHLSYLFIPSNTAPPIAPPRNAVEYLVTISSKVNPKSIFFFSSSETLIPSASNAEIIPFPKSRAASSIVSSTPSLIALFKYKFAVENAPGAVISSSLNGCMVLPFQALFVAFKTLLNSPAASFGSSVFNETLFPVSAPIFNVDKTVLDASLFAFLRTSTNSGSVVNQLSLNSHSLK